MASTTVNFNLKTAGYVNYANQTLTFKLLNAGAEASTGDESYLVLPGIVTATSAANGDGSVTLFRNGKSAIDSVYEVIFPNREKAQFIIPSGTSTVELSNLLVNSQPTGSNTQQSSVYAAAIQRAKHTGDLTLDSLPNGSITGTLAIANGGTDASSASAARTNLELGTIATQASNSVDIDGGAIDGAVIGANNAAAGTFTTLTAPTTNLTDATDKRLMTDAQETKLDAIDADVTTLSLPASTTISDFSKTFLDDSDAATVRSTLGIADTGSKINFAPRSITFPNTSAFVSVADHNNLDVGTGDFSLSFWARLDANDTQPVLQKNGTSGFALSFISGVLTLTLNTSGSSTFNLASGLNDSKWHCYVVTVDRDGNAIAYVDNVAQTGVVVSGKGGNLDNSADFLIGLVGTDAGDNIALGNYVALHKQVLTASEVTQIYNSADAVLTISSIVASLVVDLRKTTKTFSDMSTNGFAVVSNGSITFNEPRISALDAIPIGATTPAAVTGTNVLATTTLGFATGAGTTLIQDASGDKTTAITANKSTGQIRLNDTSLAANTNVSFTLTNSTVSDTDILIFNQLSGTIGAYSFHASPQSGSVIITVRNITSGALAEAVIFQFAVIQAVTS